MIDWNQLKVNYSAIGHRFEVNAETVGTAPLLKKVLESGEGCVSRFYQEGYSDTAFDTALKSIESLKGRRVYENIHNNSQELLFSWNDGIAEITINKAKRVSIGCVSANSDVVNACKEASKLFSNTTKKGYVFAITKGHGGLQLTRLGFAGTPLERTNYSQEVIRDYDYVVDDLKSKDPSGRVVILDGLPGVGKTYLAKGLLMEAPKAMFVIVPPNMVSSMGGPDLLPLLIRTREDYGKKGSTVFVLEDADQCLAPRASDNISSISAILNMGDGILGSLFDIRIIATTNAKAKDIDQAITRDMRLSKRISVKPLSYNDANNVFKRILGSGNKDLPIPVIDNDNRMKPKEEKTSFSLAEVYKAARNAGWKPKEIAEKQDTAVSSGMHKWPDAFDIPDDDEEFYDGAEYMED